MLLMRKIHRHGNKQTEDKLSKSRLQLKAKDAKIASLNKQKSLSTSSKSTDKGIKPSSNNDDWCQFKFWEENCF